MKEKANVFMVVLSSIIGLVVVIIAGFLFYLFCKPEIMRYLHVENESDTVKEMIIKQMADEFPGTPGEDFEYTINYVDEGAPNPNYYLVSVFDKQNRFNISYKVHATYSEETDKLKLNFDEDTDIDFRNIKMRLELLNKKSADGKEK